MPNDPIQLQEFQNFIDAILIRNKSILDQTTKLQDACTHLCRTISKSATTCGCITIDAHKQPYNLSEDISLDILKKQMSTHVNGKLCEECQELLEKECGRLLFYLGAIANTFDISLADAITKEKYRTEMLGKYSLK
ncbi:DUF1573 domain-containing protein [Sporanaerobium hydrogeniformans]|uniref:DUF1573 domain-containing protein n=1 Tax=Sporanaerobium hydrogeniformans TaxID=3072179 RepID=A0AC61D930_9FIRM|nr:DUF1573 domain-containing protein [Sporanaerobium hydrogeniformans]PHV69826.1 DUF1573 domain-containing protein [Sporanaerobium hydrogeniformans]